MRAVVFLLGDKLLDRLRSVTFAMLGAITAIGLILVALVLQQGWPSVLGGPLPGFSSAPPAEEAVSAATGIPAGGAASTRDRGPGTAAPRSGSGERDPAGSRESGGAHGVVTAIPVSAAPADPTPVAEAAPEAEPPPAAEPPVSAPPAAPAPSADAPASGAGAAGEEEAEHRRSANARGRSPSDRVRSKPKPSTPKPESPGRKAAPEPVEEASPEAEPPPAPVSSKDEEDPFPREGRGKRKRD